MIRFIYLNFIFEDNIRLEFLFSFLFLKTLQFYEELAKTSTENILEHLERRKNIQECKVQVAVRVGMQPALSLGTYW